MTNLELQPGETEIDSWTLFYLPPYGGKYNGKLTVTDRRLVYVASDDASVAGMLTNNAASGRLEIAKDDIGGVEVKRGLFSKKALLTLADGSVHTFDRGAMSIDKVVDAIQAR